MRRLPCSVRWSVSHVTDVVDVNQTYMGEEREGTHTRRAFVDARQLRSLSFNVGQRVTQTVVAPIVGAKVIQPRQISETVAANNPFASVGKRQVGEGRRVLHAGGWILKVHCTLRAPLWGFARRVSCPPKGSRSAHHQC